MSPAVQSHRTVTELSCYFTLTPFICTFDEIASYRVNNSETMKPTSIRDRVKKHREMKKIKEKLKRLQPTANARSSMLPVDDFPLCLPSNLNNTYDIDNPSSCESLESVENLVEHGGSNPIVDEYVTEEYVDI